MSVTAETMAIEVDGEEVTDLYPDVNVVEVELDDELAAMFRIELAMIPEPDGSWSHLDDDRLSPWREVVIHAGFSDATEPLMTGYTTQIRPTFDGDEARCRLEVWGIDRSVLMDREEKLKDWPNKKDSDIASEIFSSYGLSAEVEDTSLVHDEAISTIIQRETDIQFIQRLALRNGYECFVDGDTGYFRPPRLDDDPQPILAVNFGPETNVGWFTLDVDVLADSNVGMFQVDRTEKQVLSSLVQASLQPALGSSSSLSLLPPGFTPATAFVAMNASTGVAEMDTLCRGLFHRAEWFVSGEGLVAGNRYGHVLRPRQTVTIKGVGEAYSGVYVVTHSTHTFSADGYSQRFRVKRNALMPTGDEQFGGGDGGLLGALG
jgi:phage protein D